MMKPTIYQSYLTKHRLPIRQLKRCTDPKTLPHSSDVDLKALDVTFGQKRAVKAIKTALDIKASGYHLFAVGENGLGKRTLITRLLKERSKNEATPNDWIYVHNFQNPRCPTAIQLPAGQAELLAQKMTTLWQNAKQKLVAKLLGETHQNQIELLKSTLISTQNQRYDTINEQAKQHNLILQIKNDGRTQLVAIDENLPINTTAKIELIQQLGHISCELSELENNIHQQLDELHQNTAIEVLRPIFSPLLKQFADFDGVIHHLNAVQDDMIKNVTHIINEDDESFVAAAFSDIPSRYAINVLVSHQPDAGSPIVFEDLPTHLNLLGHIEYTTELGTVLTDVSMIRAGALHRANGGYLILEAQSLLEHPYAWQGLKRALQSKQIKISSLEQMLTLTGSLSLEPDSIDLDVKVILLGEADLYYELLEFEPEFNAVFKIRADFCDDVPRDFATELALVTKMVDMIHHHHLPVFENTAFAAILDKLSELADDQDKLDLHADRLSQLLLESAYVATSCGDNWVDANHVKIALRDMHERTSYLQELYWQEIQNGQQLIHTTGEAVGQINALTIISYADVEFGLPARLTALIAPKFGNGEILDIERDVELGGSLHAKGMLIMSSFLRSLFSEFYELNFSASLAFEQSYAHIDGDSATLAECCALLSSLADVPLKQNLAITGSMNQLGEAQAVGGINAKISGFFDACREKGLTGNQGVIVPRSNLNQLMLKDNIIKAVDDGKFHIYAVDHINEALSLLTGMAIDDKNKNGEFKKTTLFGKIAKRLSYWSENDDKNDDAKKKSTN